MASPELMPAKWKARKLLQADKQPHPAPLTPSSSIDNGTPPLDRDDSTKDSEMTRKTSLAQPGNSTNADATPETNDENAPETRDDLSPADPPMRNPQMYWICCSWWAGKGTFNSWRHPGSWWRAGRWTRPKEETNGPRYSEPCPGRGSWWSGTTRMHISGMIG